MTIPPRILFALSAAACALLLACGFYLQFFDNQDPCPLCLVQRAFYFGLMVADLQTMAKALGGDPTVIAKFDTNNIPGADATVVQAQE